MSKLHYILSSGTGLGLLSANALAASPLERTLTSVTELFFYAFFSCVVIFIILVYFAKFRDRRRTPLDALLPERGTIHSVKPDTLITACVQTMSAKKIGALIVIDDDRLVGIFTERDALNKVLAAGLDPSKTKVSDVMTKELYTISPTTTVNEAMEVVTRRHVRHLPVVENGKMLAVVSSSDLTRWLVKDQIDEVQKLVDLAAGT
jgi:predicted transcriptional regulator